MILNETNSSARRRLSSGACGMSVMCCMIALSAVTQLGLGQMGSGRTAAARMQEVPAMELDGLHPRLSAFLQARALEFGEISSERRAALEQISAYVESRIRSDAPVRLLFVCTHNSRRSHMSQLWAAAAGEAYGLTLATYSGGTEDTAFNPRAVAAVERAGFDIEKTTGGTNPIYHVRMGEAITPMTCFSKAYDGAPNPKHGFGAVMVCTEADEACPFVEGATGRFALPFVDPKISDNTGREAATYDERCAQIAREMLYIMSRVGNEVKDG
ncbi:MAG: protein-tyrosine-phosphatase [Planctomycetota bacterium]